MALGTRSTAIVRLIYARSDRPEPLPLDVERRYETVVTIDGAVVPSAPFSSPLGDEAFRDVFDAMRRCARERQAPAGPDETEESAARRGNRRDALRVRGAGRKLHQSLARLSPSLGEFLDRDGSRRLVIESLRPEIHALPWEAMVDRAFATLAAKDLSIVRCEDSFDVSPRIAPDLLYVHSRRGPGVPDDAIASVRSVGLTREADRDLGVVVVDNDEPHADLVHLIAHGDPDQATTAVGGGDVVTPEQLAERYHDRLMVLLWSCFSAKVASTGVSPAMALQRGKNLFVLAFTAPLDFAAGYRIASTFYTDVFGAAGHQDPERAVTRIRAAHFEREYEFCDWASMTLWLRSPLDLSRLPLGRLRLPERAWSDAAIEMVSDAVRKAFDRAALGDVQIAESQIVRPPLPRELVKPWTGPVVLLDGPDALRDEGVFASLGLQRDATRHPHSADLFLYLLEHLATYPHALLVWTGVGNDEVLLVQTLDRCPPNVGIVLISSFVLAEGWPGRVTALVGGARTTDEPVPPGREGFLYLVSRDRYREALEYADRIEATDIEGWSAKYLAMVKTGHRRDADACIAHLKTLDPIEAHLLSGNLASRTVGHRDALEEYRQASELALKAGRWRELGRARQEMAFLAVDMGDRGRAAHLYLSAIRLLDKTPADDRNSHWTSALARVHRDYAHLLAIDGREEALRPLRRATAIHAIEGRSTQVAYCFVTRSEALCRIGRHDEADKAAQQAAIVFDRAQNDDGWVDAIRLVAQAASARSDHAHAIAVLRSAACRPLRPGLLGRIFLQMGEASWHSGRLDDAAFFARRALTLLPEGHRHRRADASLLAQVTQFVAPSAPRVAALAGRMLGEDARYDGPEVQRLRQALCGCFIDERVECLVSSAARGADLVALEIAGRMGIRRRIVLSFDVARFRQTSVGEKDNEWTALYDVVTKENVVGTEVIELDAAPRGYGEANARILDEAHDLAAAARPLAIVAWEGHRKDDKDVTADFRKNARARAFDVRDIII